MKAIRTIRCSSKRNGSEIIGEAAISLSRRMAMTVRAWGETVILSDGDVVFQPRKVERSGIFEAVDGRVLIYIHKEHELDDVERRYPADHYVLIDDKPRILAAVKSAWGDRVTTVLPRQGQFAHAPDASSYPVDLTVERIGDLLTVDLSVLSPDRQR